jgi:hypothetical protein
VCAAESKKLGRAALAEKRAALTERQCSSCNSIKPPSDFPSTGRRCKECANAVDRQNKSTKRMAEIEQGVTKECVLCHQTKPASSFGAGKRQCSVCSNLKQKAKNIEEAEKTEMKICGYCHLEKDASRFVGFRCRDCINENEKQRRLQKKLSNNTPDPNVMKVCNTCGETKPGTQYRPDRGSCNDCERARGREYRQSDIGKEKSKEWIENNLERFAELQARRYQENKEEINKRNVERYHTENMVRNRNNARSTMSYMYATRLDDTDRKFSSMLSCHRSTFVKWIQYQCPHLDLDVDKHGDDGWHFDHVLPVTTFDHDDTDQCTMCFAWYNVAPYEAKKNMNKKEKIDLEQLKKHVSLLEKFCEENGLIINTNYVNRCNETINATHLDAGNP